MGDSEKIEIINNIIRNRRSIFPPQYDGRKIDKEVISKILENANWAPSHKLTEPWRFKVLTGEAKSRLGNFMAEKYKKGTDAVRFLEKKYNKLKTNPRRASAIVLICFRRDQEERLPEWEEIAAVAAAVQNMWLTCHAYGIGAYWSTPAVIKEMAEFIDMNEGEKCLGLFYMGYHKQNPPQPARGSISNKTNWISN